MTPTYTHVEGTTYLATWPDATLKIEATRERDWPGLKRLDGLHVGLYDRGCVELALPADPYVLDAGCGSGYGTAHLVEWYAGSAVGVDIDETAIQFACNTYQDGPQFMRSELTDMPWDDETFDGVFCVEAIEHVQADTLALAEIWRVLRGDGLLFLTTPERNEKRGLSPYHVREYSDAELRELLHRIGFDDIERLRVPEFMESLVMTARKGRG